MSVSRRAVTPEPADQTDRRSAAVEDGSAWKEVCAVLSTHYHRPDIEAARALYAAVAAHQLDGQPVWPMVVAPPGSMKTELIRALGGLPNVHAIDSITPRTFLSGQLNEDRPQRQARNASLLHRIGTSGIVLCADFSTVLAGRIEDRNIVFADMRRIFDGELRKEFGTSEAVPAWRGRITFVVAATPMVDRQRSMVQSLGDRFVTIRLPRADADAAAIAIVQDSERAHRALASAVELLFSNLGTSPAVPDIFVRRFAALAELAVHSRAHVPRDASRQVNGDIEIESATRLAQQLCQLARGSARIDRNLVVTETDFRLAVRVALDCLPHRRGEVLRACLAGRPPSVSTSTIFNEREDLRELGIIGNDWTLSEACEQLWQQAWCDSHDLTTHPPHEREGLPRGLGGTILEVQTQPQATADTRSHEGSRS